MLNQTQKTEILQLVEDEKERLGSFRAVAKKCGVSETAISLLRKGTYGADGDDVYYTIGRILGYEFDSSNWVIADTITNYTIVTDVLADAKSESMFMGIAHKAGSGKTASSDTYFNLNRRKAVFKVNAKEWNAHMYLLEVAKEIGAEIPRGSYVKVNALIEAIGDTFNRMASQKPLLIIDQANSLKPSALRTHIHLFNHCEDKLGLVIIGTDNLEHEIKKGVRLNKTGYDEFDSRFGRTYIHLVGATLADTRKICEVNGITDRDLQKKIFDKCEPTKQTVEAGDESRTIYVVEDIRRIKRLVKSERLKMKYHAKNTEA